MGNVAIYAVLSWFLYVSNVNVYFLSVNQHGEQTIHQWMKLCQMYAHTDKCHVLKLQKSSMLTESVFLRESVSQKAQELYPGMQ